MRALAFAALLVLPVAALPAAAAQSLVDLSAGAIVAECADEPVVYSDEDRSGNQYVCVAGNAFYGSCLFLCVDCGDPLNDPAAYVRCVLHP
jgi:hypothetical protein